MSRMGLWPAIRIGLAVCGHRDWIRTEQVNRKQQSVKRNRERQIADRANAVGHSRQRAVSILWINSCKQRFSIDSSVPKDVGIKSCGREHMPWFHRALRANKARRTAARHHDGCACHYGHCLPELTRFHCSTPSSFIVEHSMPSLHHPLRRKQQKRIRVLKS